MASIKLIYSVSRYWRCYILLLVASLLSFVLFYISQNDPNLEHYFPYFRGGSKYNFYFTNVNLEEMSTLMEKNYLDYEFLSSNSRYCLERDSSISNARDNEKLAAAMSPSLLNMDEDELDEFGANAQLDFVLLSISQADHFKYRSAARNTWAKKLRRSPKTKLVFFIGNPNYESEVKTKETKSRSAKASQRARFDSNDELKLETEMKDYKDIVQINMSDHDDYTSTKTLVALRWALTFCAFAKNVFVLSDSAILNYGKFEKLLKSGLMSKLDDTSIAGFCNQTDEKLSYVLKHFFSNLQAQVPVIKRSPSPVKNTTSLRSKDQASNFYTGRFCSSLGWMLTINGAKRLWMTAFRSPYMMKSGPSAAYLNGYLAFKANLTHKSLLNFYDSVPLRSTCLKVFEDNADRLLCAENFTLSSRYTSYIASWNSPGQSQLGIMIKH